MKTDVLGRRSRFSPPNPQVERITPTEPDLLLFAAIDRHGPLPAPYLYRFNQHIRKNYIHLQDRLTDLYNGDQKGSYLERPAAQYDTVRALYQHTCYKLSARGRAALGEAASRYRPNITNSFPHDLMTACIGASIELTAAELGLGYISRERVLSHPKCPEETKTSKNPMTLTLGDGKKLIPDDLFGLQYQDGKVRQFAVEADRATESIDRTASDIDQTSFGKKLALYNEVFNQAVYLKRWGLNYLNVLIITTNHRHAANLVECIRRKIDAKYQGRFYVAVEETFGRDANNPAITWRVPNSILSHLLMEPWLTTAGLKTISTP